MRTGTILIIVLYYFSGALFAREQPAHTLPEVLRLLAAARSDTARIRLMLEAAVAYLNRPGSEKSDIDSGMLYATRARDLSHARHEILWEGRSYLLGSQLAREIKEKGKGRAYLRQAIDIFSRAGMNVDLADAYREMGAYYDASSNSELPVKIDCFLRAEGLYRQAGDTIALAGTLKDLGDFYQIQEKDSIALDKLYQALALYQSVHYPKLQGTYDLIGYILYNDGNFNQALKYGLLAVQTAEREKSDSSELATIYNRIGLTYYRLLQFDTAAGYFSRSFAMEVALRDTTAARYVGRDVMDTWLRLRQQRKLLVFLRDYRDIFATGRLGMKANYLSNCVLAWLLSNDYEKAKPYAIELLQDVGDTSNTGIVRPMYRAIIPFFLASRQYAAMYKYLPANEQICKKYNILSGLADNYLWWFKADSALGRDDDAFRHYRLYKEASDSALHDASNKQIAQLQVEYETEKKDQAIALKEKNIQLLTSRADLQNQELTHARLVKNLTIGAIALLLIIIGLLFNRYRLKQRSNARLQEQQSEIEEKNRSLQGLIGEKEWLLREVHHRVKNNLQMVVSLLNSQSAYLENDALGAIRDSQRRMQAMSLIHQKLYQAEGITSISMPEYVVELADYLRTSYDAGQSILFDFDFDKIELDVAQAIPVGLILNEAITNSIKYAFEALPEGVISVSMKMSDADNLCLRISDNGQGLPEGFDSQKSNSLGMNLIRGLARQLGATIDIRSGPGLHIELRFPVSKMAKVRPAAAMNRSEL